MTISPASSAVLRSRTFPSARTSAIDTFAPPLTSMTML